MIKKYNKKDDSQKKITDSLDNRNFTGYADSNKNKDAKTVIYNAINALHILKSNNVNLLDDLLLYDPNIKQIQSMIDEIEPMIITFQEYIAFLLSIIPRLNELNVNEKQRLDTINRDIERFSVEYNKIKGNIKNC